MKIAKRIKKAIIVLLCISIVMTNVLPSFAEGNNESEPVIEEVVENESEEAIEEIVEDEPEENSYDNSEDIEEDEAEESPEVEEPVEDEVYEEEPEEDTYEEEPEEDLAEESEEVEDIPEEVEEENIASPSEIIDEEGEEDDSIPADMVEEPEEDEPEEAEENNSSSSDTEDIEDVEDPMLLGSIASPSDIEEIEEETEDEIEEASPSEIEMSMISMMTSPVLGLSVSVLTWNDLRDAINNSVTGDVITLGDNITATNGNSTINISNDIDIILDLNGKSLDADNRFGSIFKVRGTLKIKDSVGGGKITGGQASFAGGIMVESGGNVILESGSITGNTGAYGGGVYVEQDGNFIMNSGMISGNIADYSGGGIYAEGNFIMNGGEISGNSLVNDGEGGGVYFTGLGIKEIYGGKIINNIANKAGGVYINNNNNSIILGGTPIIKNNTNVAGDIISNFYLNSLSPRIELSITKPLLDAAEIYITVEKNEPGSSWGAMEPVDSYFIDLNNNNYQYFYFTNCGNIETNTIYTLKIDIPNVSYVTDFLPVCRNTTTGVGYSNLSEAINNVQHNETIKVLQDITQGTPILINNKVFTIDFAGQTFTWFDESGAPSNKDIFAINAGSNVTVKNIQYKTYADEQCNRIFKVNAAGILTLENMICKSEDNIKDIPVVNDSGTVVINGGDITVTVPTIIDTLIPIVQNLGIGTTTIKGNGTYTTQNMTGAIWLGNIITTPNPSEDPDNLCGTVVIENGTFNAGQILSINGKGNITINNAICDSDNCTIKIFHGGSKSNVIIKNITVSTTTFIQVFTILQTKINLQKGNVKYLASKFCVDNFGNSINFVSIKNGKFGPKTGSTDIYGEIQGFLASGATLTAISEYGYTYEVASSTSNPIPTSISRYEDNSSNGSLVTSPRYDSEGNVLEPSGKQSYTYDGTNPPNLTGNINVSSWNYATGTPQVNNIQYVQNTDSFIRADNTPVVTEWVGVTTNEIGKVMWYRTDATGKILKNQFIQIGTNIYYLDNNGIMATGQVTIDGKVYNFDITAGATEGRFLY